MRFAAASLARDARGAAAVEFAFAFPALLALLIGTWELGQLFFANAGLQNALAEGARFATTFPKPTEQEIRDRILEPHWGLKADRLKSLEVDFAEQGTVPYAQIDVAYEQPLDFLFFDAGTVTLTHSRRAFMYAN